MHLSYLFNDCRYGRIFDSIILSARALKVNVAQTSQRFFDDLKKNGITIICCFHNDN